MSRENLAQLAQVKKSTHADNMWDYRGAERNASNLGITRASRSWDPGSSEEQKMKQMLEPCGCSAAMVGPPSKSSCGILCLAPTECGYVHQLWTALSL